MCAVGAAESERIDIRTWLTLTYLRHIIAWLSVMMHKTLCSSRQVICLGSYSTKRQGRARRLRCKECGDRWIEYERTSLIHIPRARIGDGEVLKACALLVLSLPWRKIAQLLHRTVGSLQQALRRYEDAEVRRRIEGQLQHRYGLSYDSVTDLFIELDAVAEGQMNPKARAGSYLRLVRRERNRRILERKIFKILGIRVRISARGTILQQEDQSAPRLGE
jgi:transposase-like protein